MARKRKSAKTKFHVESKKEFLESLCPKSEDLNGNLGEASQEAASYILNKIRGALDNRNYKSFFSVKCADNIYRIFQHPNAANREEFEFTIEVLHSLLCWFFAKKHPDDEYYENHTINHLRKFLALISRITNRKESERLKFIKFMSQINLIQDSIAEDFRNVQITLDENWEFSVNAEIVSQSRQVPTKYNFKKSKLAFFLKTNLKKIIFLLVSFLILFLSFKRLILFPSSGSIKEDSTLFSRCVFSSDTTKHRILILPFKNIVGDQWKEDKGFIIKQRLDSLNRADNLNLEVKFCYELKLKDIEEVAYRSIKELYKADHIIYGFIDSETSCEKDNVCINYMANLKVSDEFLSINRTGMNYASDFKKTGNLEIAQGSLQEDIDYLIYFNALIGANSNKNYDKVISYSNKLLQRKSNFQNVVHSLRSYAFYNSLKDDQAIIESYKTLSYSKNDPFPYMMLGLIYSMYNMDEKAKYYLEKIQQKYLSRDQFFSLYGLNDRLGDFTGNLSLLNSVIKNNPENSLAFRGLRMVTLNKLGMNNQARQDSIYISVQKSLNPSLTVYTPNAIQAYLKLKASTRLEKLLENKDVYGRFKNMDSMMKDVCRLIIFDTNNLVTRDNTSIPRCDSIWNEIVSLDSEFRRINM